MNPPYTTYAPPGVPTGFGQPPPPSYPPFADVMAHPTSQDARGAELNFLHGVESAADRLISLHKGTRDPDAPQYTPLQPGEFVPTAGEKQKVDKMKADLKRWLTRIIKERLDRPVVKIGEEEVVEEGYTSLLRTAVRDVLTWLDGAGEAASEDQFFNGLKTIIRALKELGYARSWDVKMPEKMTEEADQAEGWEGEDVEENEEERNDAEPVDLSKSEEIFKAMSVLRERYADLEFSLRVTKRHTERPVKEAEDAIVHWRNTSHQADVWKRTMDEELKKEQASLRKDSERHIQECKALEGWLVNMKAQRQSMVLEMQRQREILASAIKKIAELDAEFVKSQQASHNAVRDTTEKWANEKQNNFNSLEKVYRQSVVAASIVEGMAKSAEVLQGARNFIIACARRQEEALTGAQEMVQKAHDIYFHRQYNGLAKLLASYPAHVEGLKGVLTMAVKFSPASAANCRKDIAQVEANFDAVRGSLQQLLGAYRPYRAESPGMPQVQDWRLQG